MIMYACEACPKVYQKKRHLRLHYARNHVERNAWTDKCDTCGKVFADTEILHRHQLTHDQNNRVLCEIDGCNKSFSSISSYHNHRGLFHSAKTPKLKDKLPYCCEVDGCEESFSKHHLLTQHSYKHTGILPFQCDRCDKRFLTMTHRNRHQKVHNGYPCSQCQLTYETWSLLRSHVTSSHSRVFKCSSCDKTFKLACRLKDHKIVHSASRSVFKCPQCEKTFVKKFNLKTHVKVHHNMERIKCEQANCEKTFAHRRSMKKHMETHKEDYQPPAKKLRKGKEKVGLTSRITGIDPNRHFIAVLS